MKQESIDFSVRSEAIDALGIIENDSAIEELVNLVIASQDGELRAKAIRALSRIELEDFVEILSNVVESPDDDIRWAAAMSLAEIGSQEAEKLLLQAIESENCNVRYSAAFALAELGSECAIPVLLDVIKSAIEDGYLDVCRGAICSLMKIESKLTLPLLQKMIQDTSSNLHTLVVNLLTEVNLEGVAPCVRQFFKPLRQNLESEIYEIFCNIDIDRLCQLLQSKDHDLVSSAILASEKIASPVLLSQLWQVQIEGIVECLDAIASIQERCQYYNYELEEERKAIKPVIEEAKPQITYKIDSVGILNTEGVTINNGDQIAEQYNHPDSKT